MPELPDGQPMNNGGALSNIDMSAPFSAYVHVPFCARRCGYCDFNTYTSSELGPGANPGDYDSVLLQEVALSADVLDGGKPLSTVFFGGGTPTLLKADQLAHILGVLDLTFGLEPGAEITTEANPETLDKNYVETLAGAGFNRVSVGMQSAVTSVLQILDRQHTPEKVPAVIELIRDAGMRASLDVIYGAPGETLGQWEETLDAVLQIDPGHISAYGLGIEPGTKMGAQVARGILPPTDPDDLAAKYELTEAKLTSAGYQWYEVSNWAKPGQESRHNMAYWKNHNWWGYGPGAHSHINGTRFWNVKHPRTYAELLQAGNTPGAGMEELSEAEMTEENIMLGIRLSEGISHMAGVDTTKPAEVAKRRKTTMELAADGLVDPSQLAGGTLVLTLKGRLLADTVIRALWD